MAFRHANPLRPAPQPPSAKEYDFVEQPSNDCFCPVTRGLLLNPLQTRCCGNHLSREAASRLQREDKFCPVCRKPDLTTVDDLFFKRKVNELKVRCPYKESGCEWVGEVRDLDKHERSCPKRPWKCKYCQKDGLYEIQVEHVATSCPNLCGADRLARCTLNGHLAVCPQQPVECEFSHAGCKVRVQRKDMARHMEEGAQQHISLLAAVLSDASASKDMRNDIQGIVDRMQARLLGKMEEMQTQLNLQQQSCENVSTQLQGNTGEREAQLCGKMEAMQAQLHWKLDNMHAAIQTQLCTKMEEMQKQLCGTMAEMQAQLLMEMKDMQAQLRGLVEEINKMHTQMQSNTKALEEMRAQLQVQIKEIRGIQAKMYYLGDAV